MKFILKSIFWLGLVFYLLGSSSDKLRTFIQQTNSDISQNIQHASAQIPDAVIRHAQNRTIAFSPEKIKSFLESSPQKNISLLQEKEDKIKR